MKAIITSIRKSAKGLMLSTDLDLNVWVRTETAAKHTERLVEGGEIDIQEVTIDNGNKIWVLGADQTIKDVKSIARVRLERDLDFQMQLERTRQLAIARTASAPARAAVAAAMADDEMDLNGLG